MTINHYAKNMVNLMKKAAAFKYRKKIEKPQKHTKSRDPEQPMDIFSADFWFYYSKNI
jgi:hypothetical protein